MSLKSPPQAGEAGPWHRDVINRWLGCHLPRGWADAGRDVDHARFRSRGVRTARTVRGPRTRRTPGRTR